FYSALLPDCLRPSNGGPRQSDFRPARARRRRGQRDPDPDHERGALLSAARLRLVGELAILERTEHRLEEFSCQSFRAVSTDRFSILLPILERARRLRTAPWQ